MSLSLYPFFEKLEADAKEFLDVHRKAISIPKGSLLFYQGDICENILWLSSGEVRLYIQSDDVPALTLYTLKAGEQCIINTASLLSKTPAIASAETLSDIEGYLMHVKDIKILSSLSPHYQAYLFSLYQVRFSDLANLLQDVKFKPLNQRILQWLLKQDSTMISITHEALALELGSSRVVISRLLKELEEKEKVILHRGKIEVLK